MDKFNEFYENLELQCLSLQEVAELSYAAGQQSRQAEFDAMAEALLNQTQLLAKQKVEVEEKDKRIENFTSNWRKQAKETFQDDQRWIGGLFLSCIDELEKTLRGEHE